MNFSVRQLGLLEYRSALVQMQAFTAARTDETPDELWLLEHPAVYTLGLGARDGHVHKPGTIPVLKSDRGGQVTYHGPGQLIMYLLVDLRRRGYGVRSLVNRIEQALIEYLNAAGLNAVRRGDAPGVYVNDAKIAALGLRVKNGCSYHGLALNVDMDLGPFRRIDPCGYPGLKITQLRDHGLNVTVAQAGQWLLPYLAEHLSRPAVSHAVSTHTEIMKAIAHV